MWSMVAQRLTQITTLAATPDQFSYVWKLLGLLYPMNTSKVSLNQCRGMWQRGFPTMAANLAIDSGRKQSSQKCIILII
ncbi:hypothetical protein TNCV_138451 [Trichonephila clavipes]|nr:hypothetical protein TNCV_138451 [Trichonephila clavipes]